MTHEPLQAFTAEQEAERIAHAEPRPKVTKKEAVEAFEQFRIQNECGVSPLCETVARYFRGE